MRVSNAITSSVTSTKVDSLFSKLIVEYRKLGGGNHGNSADQIVSPGVKFCESITLISGEQYSFAWIGIPISRDLDELCGQVALKLDGPTGKIRPLSRGAVYYYENGRRVQVFSGLLMEFGHSPYEDTSGGFLVDDKIQLERVNCFGRVIYDPRPPEMGGSTDEAGQYWFDSDEPLIFNRYGVGDCIDSPTGPKFCASVGFGRASINNIAGYAEPSQGRAWTSSRSWQINDMLRYLHDVYYSSLSGIVQGGLKLDRVNSDIIWPRSIGDGFKGMQRIKRNFDINGHNLNRAISKILRAAGTYDLFCKPYGFRCYLKIVDMNPATTQGTILRLPNDAYLNVTSIQSVASNASQIIHGGSIKESAMNLYNETQIVGDSPILELMCSTYNPDNVLDGETPPTDVLGQYILEQAWSENDELGVRSYVTENGDSEAAFEDAMRIFPWVYSAYRIVGKQIPWKDTKYSNCISHGHPRVRESMLTQPYGEDAVNINDWIPKEYSFQYCDTSGIWQQAEISDGLQLTPDRRVILLPGLRQAGQTWRNTDTSGNLYLGTGLRRRWIRATLAVEAEWPIIGINSSDPNNVKGLISNERRYTYSSINEPGSYVEYLRHPSSRPDTTRTTEPYLTTNYPARCTEGNELFTDKVRIQEHAEFRQSDVYRLEYNGLIKLQSLNISLVPGTNVVIKGTRTLPVEAVVKSLTINTNEQSITIELVSHDRMQQYDNQQGTIVPSQASLSEDQDDGKPIERNNEGEISSVEEKQEAIRQEKMNVYQDPAQMSSETEARTEQVRRLLTGDGADEAVKMANRRKRAETKAEQRRLDEETE